MELWLQIAIWLVYAVTMAFFAFKPRVLGLGRPLVGLCGASVIVVLQDVAAAVSGDESTRQDVRADIDVDILVYLFALMIISHYFELTGLDRVPRWVFAWSLRRFGAMGLVWTVSLVTGLTALFFTNDMAVFLLTPSVVRIVRDKDSGLHGLDILFMMNLATNANIASSMSPIGNPQNVLVSTVGNIAFGDFFSSIMLAAVVCWVLNTALLSVWLLEKQVRAEDALSSRGRATSGKRGEREGGLGMAPTKRGCHPRGERTRFDHARRLTDVWSHAHTCVCVCVCLRACVACVVGVPGNTPPFRPRVISRGPSCTCLGPCLVSLPLPLSLSLRVKHTC